MSGLIFHLIAHTHWDREWYLPRAAFQARLVPVLDELIQRLQADAAYRSFLLDGQTVLVEDYLRLRPERESDLKALVKTGRLQVGPWYVLADELVPSGEALVRNLLLGAADGERWGGRLDVLYSPDAFGHPAVWPTLAREFGIKYGVVWRGLGGGGAGAGAAAATERAPEPHRDLYRWRGPDGREVLLYHLPPVGYEIGVALPADRERLPHAWAAVRASLVERAAGRHIAVFVGADHHAAHPELPRLRDLLAELEPANAVRVSRLDEFFQAAATDAGQLALPVLTGELRWSYGYAWTLQGVHATRAPLKRRNSELELWLERFAEPLAALARRRPAAGRTGWDRRPVLESAWRTLLQAQFHDAIAGCTSDAVAQSLETRFTEVEVLARELVRDSLWELVQHDPDAARERAAEAHPSLLLWNPAARPRGGVVLADISCFRRDIAVGPPRDGSAGAPPPAPPPARAGAGYRPFALVASDGRAIPVQVLDRRTALERLDALRHYPDQDEVDVVRVAFRAPHLPGLGIAALTLGAPVPLDGRDGASVRGRALRNRLVEVALEPTGALALVDRRSGERFAGLLRLEDGGDAGDTYTYCPPARDRITLARGPIRVRRVTPGPLVAALEATYEMRAGAGLEERRRVRGVPRSRRGRVRVRLLLMLHADSAVVRCVLEVDNRATNHRLRARLPTSLAGAPAVAGGPFGSIARPAIGRHPADYPLETPVLTAPAHRFAAAAAGRRGLAVLAPGFFEYELTSGGDLLITLLRSVGELSRGNLPTRPGHAGWPAATPLAQCLGPCRIELAIVPVTQPELERGDAVPALWEDVFLPLRGFWLRDAVDLSPPAADVALEGVGLVLSAVKPAQVGSTLVLRCYNATDRRTAGAWRFGDGVKSAHRVRADEKESTALVLENRGRTVRFVAEPHEIVTIMVS